jgi:hypothetical protein
MLSWLRTHPRWRKFLLYWVPGLYLAWIILGFFAVGPITKHWVLPRLAKRLNGTLAVERVSFNPFTWRMVFDDLVINDAQGSKLVACKQIDANAEPWRTVFRTGWHLSELHLREPFIDAIINPDGSINLIKLIKPSAEPSEPVTELPRIVIDQFRLDAGEARFTDATPPAPLLPVNLHWTGLSFALDDIDTRPDKQNDHTATARTAAGETLTWTGNFFADPITSTGTIELKDFKLDRFDSYIRQLTTCTLQRGTVSLKVSYDFAPTRTPRRAAFIVESLTLNDLSLTQGNRNFLDVTKLELTDLITNAGRQAVRVKSINITGGSALAQRNADGTINLLQIPRAPATSPTTPPAATTLKRTLASPNGKPYPLEQLADAIEKLIADVQGPWTISLEKLTTKDFTLKLRDETPRKPVELTLSAIDLTAGPIKSESKYATTIELSANVPNGRLITSGTIKPLDPSAALDVDLGSFDLSTLAALLPNQPVDILPPCEISKGRLTAKGSLRTDLTTAEWSGAATISDFGMIGQSGEALTFTTLPSDGTLTASYSPWSLRYAGNMSLHRLVSKPLINGRAAKLTVPVLTSEVSRASLSRDEGLALEGTIAITDLQLEQAELSTLGQTSGTLELRADGTLSRTLNGDIACHGKVSTLGVIVSAKPEIIGPIFARMNCGVDGKLSLSASGDLNARGTVELDSPQAPSIIVETDDLAGPVAAQIGPGTISGEIRRARGEFAASGSIKLDGIKMSAIKAGDAKLTLASIETKSAQLRTDTKSISADSVSLTSPDASILLAFLPPLPDAKPAASVPTLTPADLRRIKPLIEKLSAYTVSLGSLDVRDAKLSVTDPTTTPATAFILSDASASLRGFTSDSKSPLEFNADTKVNTSGRVKVTGKLDLTGPKALGDITIDLGAIPTPPYSPVSSRYLGYTNPEGRLTAKVPVKIENDFVRGTLDANLDRFFLGDSVDSPQAISLPVKLGLALLRDRNDQIKLNIPFEGRLDDPSFSWGALVWQAVFNVLSKAATAPFQLLAMALGGGSGDDLSSIDFAPGSSELSPEMLARLDKLSTALSDRPALSLRVLASVDAEADTSALKLAQLKRSLQGKDGQTLSPAQYAQRLRSAYEGINIKPEPKSPPTSEQMEQALLDTIKLPEDALSKLAAARAQSVIDLLVNEKKLDAKRVSLAAEKDAQTKPIGPKVALELY